MLDRFSLGGGVGKEVFESQIPEVMVYSGDRIQYYVTL